MLCSKNDTHYTSCNHNESVLQTFLSGFTNETGNVDCDVSTFCYLMLLASFFDHGHVL